jgi:hypothetical protein
VPPVIEPVVPPVVEPVVPPVTERVVVPVFDPLVPPVVEPAVEPVAAPLDGDVVELEPVCARASAELPSSNAPIIATVFAFIMSHSFVITLPVEGRCANARGDDDIPHVG